MALDNARLYADRARVAGTLRRSLMPATLPVIPGLDLASFFRPMRAAGEVEETGDCGTLLGVFDDPGIRDCSVTLMPGDVLALYTDGLSDAHAPARTVSAAEMIRALARSSPSSSQAAIDTLIELIEPDGARDDIAILSAHVTAVARSERGSEGTPAALDSVSPRDGLARGQAPAAAAD